MIIFNTIMTNRRSPIATTTTTTNNNNTNNNNDNDHSNDNDTDDIFKEDFQTRTTQIEVSNCEQKFTTRSTNNYHITCNNINKHN